MAAPSATVNTLQLSLSATSPRDDACSSEFFGSQAQSHDASSISCTLQQVGLRKPTKIADTLQGQVYRGWKGNKKVVVKVTNRFLHSSSTALVDGKAFRCTENMLVEQSLLKYLTQTNACPKSIVKFISFFETDKDYFMMMEDGGMSLFDFVIKAHKLIEAGKIEISHWRNVVRKIFKQMVQCIDFIHQHNCAHFDISLENWLINDVNVEIQKVLTPNRKATESLEFIVSELQVKLCDFGLAQKFTTTDCRCSKFCGKENYKSPEVVARQPRFNAKSNDIWALGVVLFMMQTGIAPWNVASKKDESFMCIMKYGELVDLLVSWNVVDYIDRHMFDLVASIFQYEEHRINMRAIKKHPFMRK